MTVPDLEKIMPRSGVWKAQAGNRVLLLAESMRNQNGSTFEIALPAGVSTVTVENKLSTEIGIYQRTPSLTLIARVSGGKAIFLRLHATIDTVIFPRALGDPIAADLTETATVGITIIPTGSGVV